MIWAWLAGCDDPCAGLAEGKPLGWGEDPVRVVEKLAEDAFDGSNCAASVPQAVAREACTYLPEVREVTTEWVSFDRFRYGSPGGGASAHYFGAAFVSDRPMQPPCVGSPPWPEPCAAFDSGGWHSEVARTGSPELQWPGSHTVKQSVTADPDGVRSYSTSLHSDTYAWLCIDRAEAPSELDPGPGAWRGNIFVHAELDTGGIDDFLVTFDHADWVRTENTFTFDTGAQAYWCNSEYDGIDNDYDGVIDEGTDLDGDGWSDCVDP